MARVEWVAANGQHGGGARASRQTRLWSALERCAGLVRSTPFGLAFLQLIAFALVAAVVSGILYWQFNALLTRQVVATLRAEADGLAELDRSAGWSSVRDVVLARSIANGPSLYVLLDPVDAKLAGNLNRWPPEIATSPFGGVFRYDAGTADTSGERLALGVPVLLSAGVRLLVARDLEEQRQFASTVRGLFLGGLAALALTTLGLGLIASRLMLRRIGTITATAETIMAGDLSRRMELTGLDDEFDGLAARLNAMLDRIEQLVTGMSEISDNIAHDLKTPLNRLRNRAEAALRDVRGSSAHREGLERTIEAADEIIKTFNALLLIARLEAGVVDESFETFSISELVRDVAELYEPVAEEAGLAISIDVSVPMMISANRQLISQAVANLIDNAIKYGRPCNPRAAGVIVVAVAHGANAVTITVRDHGVGIPQEERARVLKRFVRLEESRTRPGTGLGLSLVAAVARLHGGSIQLCDNDPGLEVRMSISEARLVSAKGATAEVANRCL